MFALTKEPSLHMSCPHCLQHARFKSSVNDGGVNLQQV